MTGTVVIKGMSQSGQTGNITGMKTIIPVSMLMDLSSGKAQAFDTFARSVMNLSKYTYVDTTITYTFSINEILNSEGG